MVAYKGSELVKGSTALELWEAWQRDTKDRNAAQKKLDQHIKDVDQRYRELPNRYPSKLSPSAYDSLQGWYSARNLPMPQWAEDNK